ncbi:MAG: hypothetical protein U0787_19040 [Polyangia bacterium]
MGSLVSFLAEAAAIARSARGYIGFGSSAGCPWTPAFSVMAA